jgi:hypothetical protein
MAVVPMRRQKKRVAGSLVAILVVFLLFGNPAPAYAYIDPGSGSMMLQLLLGGVAGIGVLLKLYWRRISDRLRFKSKSRRP